MWELKNKFVTLLLALFILMAGSGICSAAEIIVHNGESIQAAVNGVSNGSVITIEPGTYNGNFTVDTDTITFMSSTGNPDDVIVSGENKRGSLAGFATWDVTCKGITFKSSADGCRIGGSEGATFENCKFVKCTIGMGDHAGIFLYNNIFMNCDPVIGSGEYSIVSGKDNTFIDCGKLVDHLETDVVSVELENSTEINTSKQPAPTETSTENPTETPAETSSEDNSGGSSSSGSSHHSSGSSGGGGTGGSPENQKNVASKDTTKVFVPNGKTITFNFTNDVTVVECITFESEKTVGKITAIAEDLKNKSTLVSKLPEGEVYKSFNIWVGNAGYGDSNSISNATITFKVEKSWIQENDIDPSDVFLHKYNDQNKTWIELEVIVVDEDDQYVYFTANVPGYSSFAITGKESSVSTTAPMSDEPVGGEVRSTGNGTVTKGAQESPGFGIISGIVCLLGIFLRRRR